MNFDLALVHYDAGYHQLKQLDLPLIYKEHCLRQPFVVPTSWVDRITYYSFASQTAATPLPGLVSAATTNREN